MQPTPMFIFLLLTLILDCSYNHSKVFTSSSYIFIFLSFFIRILWFTLSNADLRSIYSDHTVLFYFFSFNCLISSTILKRFKFEDSLDLKPVYWTFILELTPSFNSFHNLLFRMMSKTLKMQELLLIGLELLKVAISSLTFGIKSCSIRLWSPISSWL